MRGGGLIAVGALAASVSAPAAAAGEANRLDGAVYLPADAAAYAMVRPLDLSDGFALVDLLSGLFPSAAERMAALRAGLGFFDLQRTELSENGIDPDAPLLLAWGMIDPDDWVEAERRAARKPGGAGPVYVRHRLVVKTTDAAKFRGYMAALLAGKDFEVASPGQEARRAPRWFAPLKRLAGSAHLALLGLGGDGSVVALRDLDGAALVDVAEPWSGGPERGLPALVSKMVRLPRRTFASTLGTGGRKSLADDASLGAVLRPGPMANLFFDPACRTSWGASEGALVEDVTVTALLHPFRWRARVAFTLTPLGRSRLEGAGADDGVLDPRSAIKDSVAIAGLLLGGFNNLLSAPRAGPLAGRLSEALAEMRGCGPLSLAIVGARFWPQLLGALIDDAMPDRTSKRILTAVRNLVAVVRTVPEDAARWREHSLVLATFPSGAGAELQSFLELQDARAAEHASIGERAPTFYQLKAATGFEEAGVETLPLRHTGLVLASAGSGPEWYYSMPRLAAREGPQTTVGYLYVNVGRILGLLAESADRGTQAALKLASSQLGILGGELTLEADALQLDLTLGSPAP